MAAQPSLNPVSPFSEIWDLRLLGLLNAFRMSLLTRLCAKTVERNEDSAIVSYANYAPSHSHCD